MTVSSLLFARMEHPLAILRSRAGGITQAELALKVGVTVGMVSQWERYEATPRYDRAAKIDEVLEAKGQALEAFGYMPPGTLKKLERYEAALGLLLRELQTVQALTADRVAVLDRLVKGDEERLPGQ